MVWKALVAIAVVSMASPAVADEPDPTQSGNEFLAVCGQRQTATPFQQGLCLGFVIGMTKREFIPGTPQKYCAPDRVAFGQRHDIILKYVNAHPETRHLPTTVLAQWALAEAYPCTAAQK